MSGETINQTEGRDMHMKIRILSGLAGLCAVGMLAGCSIHPIKQDQPVTLAPGEGLAAIEFATLDPLTGVFIRPAGNGGKSLQITAVPAGRSLFLFQVPAGHYCFQQFHYGNVLFYGLGAELSCFQVPKGELGYSGRLSPLIEQGKVMVHQDYDYPAFRELLKEKYPQIAAQFKPEPVSGPEANEAQAAKPVQPARHDCEKSEQVCSWAVNSTNSRSQTIYIKNNTKWPIRIALIRLYSCINVKQKCDTRQVNIKLAPHKTGKVMTVDPADPDGAYTYQFYYEYGFDLSGQQ